MEGRMEFEKALTTCIRKRKRLAQLSMLQAEADKVGSSVQAKYKAYF